MTKFIQKKLLIMSFIIFSNLSFAQKWPYFSTDNIKQNYIELNKPFKKSSKTKDLTYRYYLTSKFRKPINETIKNKKSSILLVPDAEKSHQKKNKYFIFINDYMIGTTKIHREKTKK